MGVQNPVMPAELPPVQTQQCVACGSTDLVFCEHVTTEQIATMWARDRRANRMPFDDDTFWRDAVTRAIGAAGVRFDRCSRCGLEMASPRMAWPEGAYPEDENYPQR